MGEMITEKTSGVCGTWESAESANTQFVLSFAIFISVMLRAGAVLGASTRVRKEGTQTLLPPVLIRAAGCYAVLHRRDGTEIRYHHSHW